MSLVFCTEMGFIKVSTLLTTTGTELAVTNKTLYPMTQTQAKP